MIVSSRPRAVKEKGTVERVEPGEIYHGSPPPLPPPPSHYDTRVGVGVLMDPRSTPALSVPLWGWGS